MSYHGYHYDKNVSHVCKQSYAVNSVTNMSAQSSLLGWLKKSSNEEVELEYHQTQDEEELECHEEEREIAMRKSRKS